MSSEKASEDSEGSKKRPIVKIVLIVVLVLILLGGAVLGTLFAVGFFAFLIQRLMQRVLSLRWKMPKILALE